VVRVLGVVEGDLIAGVFVGDDALKKTLSNP